MKDGLGLYAETLGAYLEGKLPKGEMSLMNKVVEEDRLVSDLLEEMRSTVVDWSDDIRSDYPDFDERFELPSIPEQQAGFAPRIGRAGLAARE